MIRLIKWLILGHVHEWETVRTIKCFRKKGDELPSGFEYHLRCKTCGKVKVTSL